ncbi:MAG: sulfotransferase domain-containing protein [Geitlerinemataceae cyanobacterium]
MRLPNFLIIGAAKAGTTTLYEYLCRHPQIFMSTPKEPEFFARDENYARGIDWYSSLFDNAQPHQICGEASTIYTRSPQFPHTAARIAQHIPQAKLIYLMRHPVDRAYSHYVQRIKTAQNKKEKLEVGETFEERIERESFFIDSSNYVLQIEQYLRFFQPESFLFLLMKDVTSNSAETLKQVCRFLEIDDTIDLLNPAAITANQAKTHETWFVRSRMTAPLKRIPGVSQVASALPQNVRDLAYNFLNNLPYKSKIKKKYVPTPMLAETRQKLLETFREPNQQLAQFLDRDLSRWKE